jgi:hypothetical protein
MADIPSSVLDSAVFTDFLFNNLTSAIFLTDSSLRVRKVNDTYRTLFAKEEIEVLDQICGNSLGCQFAVEQSRPCGSTSECANCLSATASSRPSRTPTASKTRTSKDHSTSTIRP